VTNKQGPFSSTPQLSSRISYWTRDEEIRNFGDHLCELIVDRALIAPIVVADRYYMIGSMIDEALLAKELSRAGRNDAWLACWGCGARSASSLTEQTRQHVQIFGVRGPLTRNALGLPDDTPLGDPGLLLPLLHVPKTLPELHGKSFCIPHFSDPADDAAIAERTGADLILRPRTTDIASVLAMIDQIASADVILAGSLHAAIVAFAYGRPFAFFDGGYIDLPFKWRDFASSIGIEAEFVQTIAEARAWYDRVGSHATRPKLLPILGVCPWAVQPAVLVNALLHDLALTGKDVPANIATAMVGATGMLEQGSPSFIREARRTVDVLLERGTAAAHCRTSHGDASLATRLRNIIELAADVRGQASADLFRFYNPDKTRNALSMAKGEAGAGMLVGRWSAPNAIGPVSNGNGCRIVLPESSGWQDGETIVIEAFVFAPPQPPFHHRREIIIHLNGTRTPDEVLVNTSDGETVAVEIRRRIPPALRTLGGDLEIEIAFPVHASPTAIGLRTDDREIGIIPRRIWLD